MKIKVTNLREHSPIRMCSEHKTYFIDGNGEHADHYSIALQWAEVIFYLDKLRTLKDLVSKIRREWL